MSTIYRFFRLSFLLFFSLVAVPLHADEDSQPQAGYEIGSGDMVSVKVYDQVELSGDYRINGLGQFSMPYIGIVQAEGLTRSELGELIINKLKPDYLLNPRVNVEVLNFRPYYIIGEVNSPRSYAYVEGMTYLNAVAIAGGFTYRAKKKYVMVKHKENTDKKEVKLKLTEKVMPGDIIRVAERLF